MPTLSELLMLDVLARLRAARVVASVDSIRRDHRTVIRREDAPAVHLVDGTDAPGATRKDCSSPRDLAFTITIFVRDDAGYAAADPIKLRVMNALNPYIRPYPGSALLDPGLIDSAQDIADGDALRTDMHFSFKYFTPAWRLDQPNI